MTGHDERREVARKLRAGAEYLPNDMYSEDLELELAKTVCRYDTPSVNVLFNRLADLIEPEPERTARLEYDEVHCDYVCTACGERTPTGVYEAVADDDRLLLKPMRFCPNCGARVVSE